MNPASGDMAYFTPAVTARLRATICSCVSGGIGGHHLLQHRRDKKVEDAIKRGRLHFLPADSRLSGVHSSQGRYSCTKRWLIQSTKA